GWDMPIQYTGIVEEHRAVRTRAGLFDVSHMLRTDVRGPGAAAFLRRALTYNVRALPLGRAHYALICDPDGGIRDDAFVYRPADEEYLLIGNASNAEADLEWLRELLALTGLGAELRPHADSAMLALQGPRAVEIGRRLGSPEVAALSLRGCAHGAIAGCAAFVARTGYTGEDGYEIVVAADDAVSVWRAILATGASPIGLGARDTLRLEAALPLYGNDIDRTTRPYEAGLGWVVDLDDGADFIGRDAILTLKDTPPSRVLVCLRAEERGVMRHGYPVLHAGQAVGTVTSGTFSPTLGVSIGMAYVPPAQAKYGARLEVDVRGKRLPVRVVPRPFYRREMTG
ncbi:MAG: glycine cleavage system aminomethyltransferase GcvT, partial [Dehalococcoidia bacterium]|nr:glycine cleavage system aminomethyltransferase GcvT [Dehalococcoidia bacterium]